MFDTVWRQLDMAIPRPNDPNSPTKAAKIADLHIRKVDVRQ